MSVAGGGTEDHRVRNHGVAGGRRDVVVGKLVGDVGEAAGEELAEDAAVNEISRHRVDKVVRQVPVHDAHELPEGLLLVEHTEKGPLR